MQHHKKVIQFPAPPIWTFWDFIYPNGSNPIKDWYSGGDYGLSDEGRYMFDALLKNMRRTENHLNWGGFRGFLKGAAKSERIWEIGFQAEGKQYRVFSVFGGRKQVILLVGCYHKQRVYTPADAIETAIKRSKLLAEKGATINERPIRDDF